MLDAFATPPAGAPSLRPGLFVTGATARSRTAIDDLRRFCDAHLEGSYEREAIGLYRTPARARWSQVVAAPTPIRYAPEPRRHAIGDLSDAAALGSLLLVA